MEGGKQKWRVSLLEKTVEDSLYYTESTDVGLKLFDSLYSSHFRQQQQPLKKKKIFFSVSVIGATLEYATHQHFIFPLRQILISLPSI